MTSPIIALQHYGLTEKEAKVYTTALSLGSAPGSTIARHAGENRATVYSILKELHKKQIVTEVKRNGVAYFSVISPDALLQQREEKYATFRDALPMLLAMADQKRSTAKMSFFEGIHGIKQMYEDTLTSSAPISAFLGVNVWASKELIRWLNTSYVPRRVEKGIRANVIASGGQLNQKYASVDKKAFRQTKVITAPEFMIHGEIALYGPNKVSLIVHKDGEISGTIIESEHIYTSLMSIFTFMRNSIA